MSKRLEGQTDKIVDAIEWLVCVVVAVIIALVVRFYIGTPTVVKQQSMKNTLMPNERLWLNRLPRTRSIMPERGDIVTFEAPTDKPSSSTSSTTNTKQLSGDEVKAYYEDEDKGAINNFIYYVLEIGKTSYIKRVIGLPGDKIRMENGNLFVNDELQNESYLRDGISTDPNGGRYVNLVVPEGYIFLMGDNRPESKDCRHFGCIPLEKIESKVVIRFWPINKFGTVK